MPIGLKRFADVLVEQPPPVVLVNHPGPSLSYPPPQLSQLPHFPHPQISQVASASVKAKAFPELAQRPASPLKAARHRSLSAEMARHSISPVDSGLLQVTRLRIALSVLATRPLLLNQHPPLGLQASVDSEVSQPLNRRFRSVRRKMRALQ